MLFLEKVSAEYSSLENLSIYSAVLI